VQRAALCVCRTLVRAGRTDLRMTTRKLGYPTKYLRVPPAHVRSGSRGRAIASISRHPGVA
jgi:hypothetical protein